MLPLFLKEVKMDEKIKDKLDHLPHRPGCYLMKNLRGEIIYVGKAKDLWNRVHSYFTGAHNPKTEKMVSHIADFDYILTSTEEEAFILEMNLIKKNRPHYNIDLMDDKQYPCIALSNDAYPRLYVTRDTTGPARHFGPYPSARAAHDTVDFLNLVYPLRKCARLPKEDCLYHHLGQCLAPCVTKVEESEYALLVKRVTRFLKGQGNDEEERIESAMEKAAEALDFERAIALRDLLSSFREVQKKQAIITSPITDADAFGWATDGAYLAVFIFHVRVHKIISRSTYLVELVEDEREEALAFLGEYYLVENRPLPARVILPAGDYASLDEAVLSRVHVPVKGVQKDIVTLAETNAREALSVALQREKARVARTRGAQDELARALGLDRLDVIESFDNSNNQGQDAVSAMIVVEDGEFKKKAYRKYRVKTVEGASDYATMIEVITRRYTRLREESSPLPDLIIQDGGEIQVDAATRALSALGLAIPVLGLVKNDRHRTESLWWQGKSLPLDKRSDLFYFLENVQDEVHRYAISFYHLVAGKNAFTTRLDEIPGIGSARKKAILRALASGEDFPDALARIRLTADQRARVLSLYSKEGQ